jgi:hypothetical protein
MQFGIRQNPAMTALHENQNNPKLAMKSIHQMITSSLKADLFASQAGLYKSRITSRIRKLLLTSCFSFDLSFRFSFCWFLCYLPSRSLFLGSWLPNYIDKENTDYHTRYVCTLAYDCVTKEAIISWQLDFRYSDIKELYYILQKYSAEINDVNPMNEHFPLASVSHGLFGIDDKTRNERMSKFDLWIREILMNPFIMTIYEVAEGVYKFLEFDKHVKE